MTQLPGDEASALRGAPALPAALPLLSEVLQLPQPVSSPRHSEQADGAAAAAQRKSQSQTHVVNLSTPPANLAQYVRSSRGTDLVFFEGNTYTPNEKLREGQKSRDWKCSMYHKAKCRARLNTRISDLGDLIHMTSHKHTHTPMYLLQQEGAAGDARKLCLTRNPQCEGLRTAKGGKSN
ncbi:PREDICTED: uncharacterized protein LOC108612886 [Drosophila arizonae]|uniref:Uncharacterized protein LOC108612886 n=1 Tax=Drosophila arizonae TaxID=7263 RepID=A0ABM1P3S0_DROAR|nr:PREDICTED: uncharacterized protein LOC108612886 [Drosophila arizonae]